MNDKLIAELREYFKNHCPGMKNMDYEELQEILSRHTPAVGPSESEVDIHDILKQVQDQKISVGKAEELLTPFLCELEENAKKTLGHLREFIDPKYYHGPTPSTPEIEPLAVLADRKGFWLNINQHNGLWHIGGSIKHMVANNKKSDFYEECHTYSATESKARAYLMALPDKGVEK